MMLLYRALLYLYPASWRAEYGGEMCSVFAARRRDTRGLFALLALWLEVLPDLLTNAIAVQWDLLCQDLRYAARALRRSPGFALTAVAIAAIGIGATTAAFTMVDHVLIRPFPFARQDRLVKLREDDLSGLQRFWDVSPANYRDWKRMSTSYESMGAYRGLSVNMTGTQGDPQRIDGASLTAELLPTLGVHPPFGRVFTEQDDRHSAPGTVILSYGLWQEQFGGTSAILGRTIELDNVPYTIIGVMPKDFYFPTREARLWTPMRFAPDDFEDRTNTYIFPVGRLKPGVSLQQAQAEMRAIGARLARAYPKELTQVSVEVVRLRDDVSERSRLMLNVLLGAALCVLLIACTNLANLLLARAMVRRRELAVRAALGAGRERLVRQMLTESLILALPGGALGLLVAHAALPLLVRLVPVSLPIAEIPALDGRVLLFAAVLTFATGIGFGIMPALRSGLNTVTELHEGGRSGMGGRRERLRSALVITEVACSIVLLVGFGLLTRALWRIQAVDPGFRADHVLTLRTSLPMPRYETPESREPFYRHVLEETRRLPGVTAAGFTSFLPLVLGGGIWPVQIQGHPEDLANRRTVSLRFVTPGFFSAMRIPLLAGRDVRQTDSHKAPFVALVSQSFVQRYWRNENPLGHHIDVGNHDRTVIGVVGDIHVRSLERSSEPQVYVSWQQADDVSTWYAPKDLVVRTTGDPTALVSSLRRIIRRADPRQPVSEVRTLTDIVEGETASRRVQLAVLGAFGAIAFLLAAVGIHGLLAFAVSSRTQEIGVRMALGAQRADIINMTVGEGFKLAVVGIIVGIALAYGAGRLLQSLLAGVKPWDLGTFTAAVVLSVMMTLAGSLLPAIRAVRVDPTTAMRAE
ncbi:MAG: ABC transporter permease [Bryobacteraceae bacterium]